MKASLNKILCTLLCALFTFTLSAQDKKQDAGSIVGDWAYTAVGAPVGYDTGVLKIKPDKGMLTGEVVMGGQTTKINEIRKDGDAYKCTVYVDGYPVNVTLRKKGEVLEGTSEVDGEINTISFKRANKK